MKKVVTNSGDLDGTTVYLYQGQQIIETRDGSGNVELQVYHGTRYIDEVVGLRVKDQGRLYASQGERSERELPAIGKASTTRASGRRACPE